MGVFEMIVFVTAISVGGGVWIEHFRTQQRRLAAGSSGDAARMEKIVADARAEIASLKDRVRVLEALATDTDRRLADDIERLRPGVSPRP